MQGVRRSNGKAACGRSTRCRSPASSATTRGSTVRRSTSGNTNVWAAMAYDPELDYVYISVSTPSSDYYGGHRPGNNLFAESLVCVRGEDRQARVALPGGPSRPLGLRLSNQPDPRRHHGERPADQGRHPGQQAGVHLRLRSQNGRARVADRGASRPAERPCRESARRRRSRFRPSRPPFDRAGHHRGEPDRLHAGIAEAGASSSCSSSSTVRSSPLRPRRARSSLPGTLGGANWGGAAFDPETGILYVPSRTTPNVMKMTADRSEDDEPSISDGRRRRERGGQFDDRRPAPVQAAVRKADRDRFEQGRAAVDLSRSETGPAIIRS